MELWLYRVQIYAPGARILDSKDNEIENATSQSLHYWGVVASHLEDSIAAISFSDDEIKGIVQLADHQYVLGKMENSEMEVFYRDDQLKVSAPFEFDTVMTPEDSSAGVPHVAANEDGQGTDVKCVKLYVEVEYDVFETFRDLNSC